jgi:hypothetical protein
MKDVQERRVQVGAADPAVPHLEENVARLAARLVDILDFDFALLV